MGTRLRAPAASRLVLLLALLAGARAGGAQELRVAGRVVDRVSGAEIPGVDVLLLAPGVEAASWRGTTDGSGSFLSTSIPAGAYELRTAALGFAPVRRAVDLAGARVVELRIELVPEAVELEPLVVTAPRRSRLEAAGFYDRRRMGSGHTLTREEIEARNPLRVSDVFRTVPGVQVVPVRGGTGSALRFRGDCQPDLVVDRVPVSPPYVIDELLSVGDLEAVEVHSGTLHPARVGSRSCGTVLVWTRDGSGADGRPITWLRTLVAGAIAVLSLLLAR